jgi:seryl-tRNA synthetase
MLDIKFIRENKDIVSAGARKKHVDFDVEALLVLDDKRKALQASVEAKKAKQNEVSTKIPTASAEERQSLINEMQIVKAEFQKEDEVLMTMILKKKKPLVLLKDLKINYLELKQKRKQMEL